MVCIAANGSKFPLSIHGKKNIHLFKIRELSSGLCRQKPWFAQIVTVWRIKKVFGPYHLKTHRNVYALLILNNCSGQKDLDDSDVARKFLLRDKLYICLPPNITSRI